MCAITGIISLIPEYKNPTLLQPILSKMRHRGPDGTAIEKLSDGCFGHNRLSIIDLHVRSKQPMWDHSHRYCVTLNGEIYNYRELKKELLVLHHSFTTESDTEVLVEAWAEWGVSSISKLVGMFAFAIWDDALKQLYLVRDRMGEKPLFYAPIQNNFHYGIVFSSILRGLTQYPFIQKNISLSALDHYLSFGYTATHDCIYKDIYKLSPASCLQYDLHTKKVCIKPYWILSDFFKDKKKRHFLQAKEELHFLLGRAVQQQSLADVPLGAFLSGGIDSSSIVANMSNTVHTFGFGFQEKTYSEIENSKAVAAYLQAPHHTRFFSRENCAELKNIIAVLDEPFSDNSMLPTYFLSRFAKQNVSVCLSGDGGDELFGGYATYQADRYYQWMRYLPLFARKQMNSLVNHLPVSFNKVSFDYKIKRFMRGCLLNAMDAHLHWRVIFDAQDKAALLKTQLITKDSQEDKNWFNDVSDCHYLDQAMYVDMKTWLVDDILVKADSASMAHSLEVRAPFLDHRIVEFAASLPVSYKFKKRILKKSQQNKLPAFVFRQSKKGFNSPISHWLLTTLRKIAEETLFGEALSKWCNQEYIKKLWLEHEKGVCDNSYRLFNLLCLGLWLQG